MEQETGADGTLGIEAVGGPSGGNDDDRHGEAGYGEAEVGFFRPEPCRADEEDLQDWNFLSDLPVRWAGGGYA